MKRFLGILPLIAVTLAISFNLWLFSPELSIKSDPNDNIFQFTLVNRTNIIWQQYGCPWRLSCWPRLLDHWTPEWAEGYPLPFYYSHIPQIAIVASYHLISRVIRVIGGIGEFSLLSYYHFITYLVLSFFPLPVFWAMRVMGFSPLMQVFGALFASHISTDGLYGMDNSSYLWRGYGLSSQLFATFFMPLAFAYSFRTLMDISTDFKASTPPLSASKSSSSTGKSKVFIFGILNLFRNCELGIGDSVKAIIALTATLSAHLGLGYIALLSLLPLLFMDFGFKNIIKRAKKLALIGGTSLLLLSYWIVPFWLNKTYHNISVWDPLWKFNSFGYFNVLTRFFEGELIDFGRFPVLTILTVVGFFVLLFRENRRNKTNKTNREKYSNQRRSTLEHKRQPTLSSNTIGGNYRAATNIYLQSGATSERVLLRSDLSIALLFPFWLFLFFGRTTWGPLLKFLPGAESFHLHRFINGLHLSVLFLAPAAAAWLVTKLSQLIVALVLTVKRLSNPAYKTSFAQEQKVTTIPIVTTTIILLVTLLPLYRQTISYANPNSEWLTTANKRFDNDWPDFKRLIATLRQLPSGRIYAGKPGYWGKDFKIGDTQVYMALSVRGFEVSQFLPETWSPNSDTEQFFDERIKHHYDLYNIRYVVAPPEVKLPDFVVLKEKFGKFWLYQIDTSGYFTIGKSSLLVSATRSNFYNLVHLWQISSLVEQKLFPILTLNKKPNLPSPASIISLVTPTTYRQTDNQEISIFARSPLFIPQNYATPSATFAKEQVKSGQKYKTKVSVPSNCIDCFAVFKMTYHPNWRVFVDGNLTDKMIVFPFFIGIPIKPGDHSMVVSYQPSSLKVVLLIGSLLGITPWLMKKWLR